MTPLILAAIIIGALAFGYGMGRYDAHTNNLRKAAENDCATMSRYFKRRDGARA
jgi:hypothetical protein